MQNRKPIPHEFFTYWNPGGTTWNFHTAPISMDGRRTHVYYLVKDLNQEIQHLARIFLGAQAVSVAHTGPSIPKGTKPLTVLPAPFRSIEASGPGVLVSHLRNGDNDYLMVINRDLLHPQQVTVGKLAALHRVLPTGRSVREGRRPTTANLQPGDYLLYEWKR